MHLLVLSAFRPAVGDVGQIYVERLNAPSGAQCFPTHIQYYIEDYLPLIVSMHLLVLSAFRH